MRFHTKIIAGVAAGAALAAGGIAAIDMSSEPAEAQGVSQADLKAANERSIAAIRIGKWIQNQLGIYVTPDNQLIGVKQPPGVIRQQRGTGQGGLGIQQLDDNTNKHWPRVAKYSYNGGAPMWEGWQITDITRTAQGQYQLTYAGNPNESCVYKVAIGYYKVQPEKYAVAQTYQGPAPNTVMVHTYKADTTAGTTTAWDYDWHINVECWSTANGPGPGPQGNGGPST